MAQVKPMGLIESMSGKVCEHSDMYFFHEAIELHRRMSGGHYEE